MTRKQVHKIREQLLAEYPKLAPRARAAMAMLKTFCIHDLDDLAPAPHKKLKYVIRDFRKRGEVRIIKPGQYEYVPKEKARTLLDIIWHLVRSCKRFTVSEMVRLSGAKNDTVREYLYCLRNLGYIKPAGRSEWIMIKDPGPATPTNTAKCKKLKKMYRQRKKQNSEAV